MQRFSFDLGGAIIREWKSESLLDEELASMASRRWSTSSLTERARISSRAIGTRALKLKQSATGCRAGRREKGHPELPKMGPWRKLSNSGWNAAGLWIVERCPLNSFGENVL